MLIADLHIHSRYSRATSRDCVPELLDFWAARKGIGLVGTGDFTHPAWREELEEKLAPAGNGLYRLKPEYQVREDYVGTPPEFVVSGEISTIYKKNGRVRKVHHLILLPGLEEAGRLAKRLEEIGNLHSDGRPILGLDSRDLLEITLESCPDAIYIPAHIWTPHFSLFGAFSGFDSIEECFEDLAPQIHAVETGLSSDPPMNWRVSALDGHTLVSHSDAHSPQKLGREADLLEIAPSYPALARALREGKDGGFAGTIEFFPEEGKYHYDGHRACGLCLRPQETVRYGGKCPVCGKKLTIGVEHRVEELADREDGYRPAGALPFESLAPLAEVIGASTGRAAVGKKVQEACEVLLRRLGPEFDVLRTVPPEEIGRIAGPCVAEGIRRLRAGKVRRIPGYDGVYGTIELLTPAEMDELNGQLSLLPVTGLSLARKSGGKLSAAAASPSQEAPAPQPAEELNAEQAAAVHAGDGTVAVIAGPGTGKTKTLAARVLSLIRERGVKPAQIAAVTFTNQAAGELRERLARALGSKRLAGAVTVGTFHGICYRQLRKWRPQLRLADEAAQRQAAGEVLEAFGSKWSPERFLRELSGCKNRGETGSETFPAEWYAAYQQKLEEQGLMDFDDLLLEAIACWESPGAPQKREAMHFRHLLVDEFQDINPLQYRLIRLWSREGASLFCIGDPDQAIYGFRGADPHCFDRLREDAPGLQTIRLSRNYRSSPQILGAAQALISHNPGERGELLPQCGEGVPVTLVEAESERAEAIGIAKRINRLVGGLDMLEAQAFQPEQEVSRSFSEIAVLYRTHRQGELLEECLQKEGVPYVVVGRDESLLRDETVAGTVSFFRFLLDGDDLPALTGYLRRIERLPQEACRQAARVWRETHSWDALAGEHGWTEQLETWRKRLSHKPERLLADWIAERGFAASEPLDRLLHMAGLYPSLEALLQTLSLGEEGDWKRRTRQRYTSDAVTLMTLHAAKGLEFPLVFLAGLKQGVLPLDRAGASLEEERRLCFVGMTRAREELILSCTPPESSFAGELPETVHRRRVTGRASRPAGKQLSLFDRK